MYPSRFASRAKKNIPHACLPVHRHLSSVYCMSVWNMSWYVNVFLVQSHNNIDITCAVISYIYHTCIYICIYVYTDICECVNVYIYIHMCVSCPIIFTMRLALPHGTSLCVPPRKKYITRFEQHGFTQMSLHDKSSKHILNTKWHHQVSRFRIFVIRRYVMHSLQQRHPPI